MAQFKDKYHKAAKDGNLDILKEASRRDCDTRDEDGMTPVMWSSFCGRIDALRRLMSRGGNPDLTDYLGNTALHHASANGHLPCCTYLVNYGANIWSLDNDRQTALDVASVRGHRDVVGFLDSVMGDQKARNPKMVRKLTERGVLAADKRRKEYEKMQAKAQRRLEKDEQQRSKQREKMNYNGLSENEADENQPATSSAGENPSDDPRRSSQAISGTNANAGVAKKVGKKKHDQASRRSQEFRITEEKDGRKSVRSLTGLKRNSEIIYTTSAADSKQRDNLSSNAVSEPGLNGGVALVNGASLFERPGFGSVAFLSKPNVSATLMSLPGTSENMNPSVVGGDNEGDQVGRNGRIKRSHSNSDSIGTAGSLVKRMGNLPWSEDEVENLDDDEEATDSLELFLACHSLTEYASMLAKEKIDLDALLLCDDEDLKKIGLHLGPRKKLLDAIEKRKKVLEEPGCMLDTFL